MHVLDRLRSSSTPLLWDGGVGTGLRDAGLDLAKEPPEAWLLSRPAEVQRLHGEFAGAGADVLQTNSFGLLRLGLPDPRSAPLPGPLPALVQAAVKLAQAGAAEAAERAPLVIASLGPSGLDEAGSGPHSPAALVEGRAEQLAALFYAAGVRTVHLETFYQGWELEAAVRGVRAGAPGMDLLCSLTLSAGNSGWETPAGTPLAYMLRVLERVSPDGIGVNCSQNWRRMLPQVTALRRFAGAALPLLAQPQVGAFGADCRGGAKEETGDQFRNGALRLLEAGASAVGGCCGCRGYHLAALRRGLDSGAHLAVQTESQPGGLEETFAQERP